MQSFTWNILALGLSFVTGTVGQYQDWTLSLAAADKLLANLTRAQIANITAGQDVDGVFAQTSSLDGKSTLHPSSVRPA